MNEGNVVRTGAEVRNEIADPFAALAVWFPVPGTFHYRAGIALEQFHFPAGFKFFSTAFDQLRLVIERVTLAGCSRHEQLHHAFGSGPMMRAAVPFGTRSGSLGKQSLLAEQMSHGDAAEASSEAPEKFATIDQARILGTENRKRRLLRGTDMTTGISH